MAARILVVDDERSVRITMSEFLRDSGYEVDVAEGLERAWELLAIENFDVVSTQPVRIAFLELSARLAAANHHWLVRAFCQR